MLWARAYTVGLPDHARRARLEELESDLWESDHDATRASTTGDVLGRWLSGIVDDLRWRVARATRTDAIAIAMATAVVVVAAWLYASLLGPQALPQPHGAPMRFVSDKPAPPPPPPPPPPR